MHDADEAMYWCYRHQQVEPITWDPHPDHLRIGPMRRADAEAWRHDASPWAAEVLPLGD